jgi:hypothetical protein
MKATQIFSTLTTLIFAACMFTLTSCEECDVCTTSVFFEGQYTTYPAITDTTGGILVIEIPGEGTATTLGNSKWYSDSEVFANVAPPWVQTGSMYFEDANGDRLIGSFTGTAWPLTENPFAGEGEYQIDSGTGVYEGASGSGTYEYIASPQMVGDLVFTGILTVPIQDN